ncbi:unnamed protein product [Bursaphelenchus okinawaensis]|uniref:COMM domain-containing protein n=1 Tax=Bursaphelenchus okinawaensis TaxID=465554 RepID=A0A811L9L0_9BILA|nr:unnamed protein product [Bursaphelenchus okinawaensis]CAG9119249.1 unnamed protein product [Bursaphelenchus okinawaensis]
MRPINNISIEKMVVEFGEQLIRDVYSSIKSGKQLRNVEYIEKIPQITTLHKVFKHLEASANVDKALADIELAEDDKKLIGELVETEKKKDIFDWKVSLILSNSQTFKCLTPKVELNIDGQDLEFDVETFEQLRYEVARTLNRLQKYHEIA